MTCKHMTRPTIEGIGNSVPSKRLNKKALNYPKYIKGVDLNAHVHMFKTMI
jgi:hypothetical protein